MMMMMTTMVKGQLMTSRRVVSLLLLTGLAKSFVPTVFTSKLHATRRNTNADNRECRRNNACCFHSWQVATEMTTTTTTTTTTTSLRMGLLDKIMGEDTMEMRKEENAKYLSSLQGRVDRINSLENEIEQLGDEELIAKTDEFRNRLKGGGEDINGPLLEEAFAVVREAAWRVLELRHYDVQLLGGLILHEGRLAEMATGEGKTLVSTLPAYVNALIEGKSSFVITVNDYLARRDMEKMGQIFRFLGLSVGLIQASLNEEERKEAYSCDVVYVTNSELGFDYLRDHLAVGSGQTVLPNFSGEFDGFCIVDEADSILIDEARTPLIISKQVPAPADKYQTANAIANALREGIHYTVDLKNKNVILTDVGYRDSENALGVQDLFTPQSDGEAWAPFVSNAVKAKELFKKDVEYAVLEDDDGRRNGVGIIDAFTGRVLDGRRWSDGLHQSIEAKEGIAVSEKSQVIAKVTYQALFRQFTRLSGMTGTALTDAAELEAVYGLRVTTVPTALPVARRDYPDIAFKTRTAANDALVKEVVAVGGGRPDGRPCLIGTTSVLQSEALVAALKENGIEAELLNASPKNAPRESEIIAQAGRAGVVTVATNMAGRGTDILLGGCPKTMARIKARSVLMEGGVLADTKANDMLPPSPPESYFPRKVGDDVMSRLAAIASAIKKDRGSGISDIELDEILTLANEATESEDDPDYVVALRDACESINEQFAEALEAEKAAVKERGGLYVMGTNRHESSRIDQQLRGRAGRQGDPGSSRFFLSFEDDMFVIFGGDSLNNILRAFRVSDDMPVEAPQVEDALNKVQLAVEQKYREMRTEIFSFDETLNSQREVIYERRQDILFSEPETTLETMRGYHTDTIDSIVEAQTDSKLGTVKTREVANRVGLFFPGVLLDEKSLSDRDPASITVDIANKVNAYFDAKMNDMEAAGRAAGRPPMGLARSANYIILVTMDNAWSDHLQAMENLKETVILRKYQGLDPVNEYRSEAFALFEGLIDKMRNDAVYSLWQSLAPKTAPQAVVP